MLRKDVVFLVNATWFTYFGNNVKDLKKCGLELFSLACHVLLLVALVYLVSNISSGIKQCSHERIYLSLIYLKPYQRC